LLELGAETQQIAFHLFESKTFAAARLWGRVVGGIELDRQRQIVFAYMSQAMLHAEGATVDEAEGIAEYLRGVEEAEVVMLLKETEEGEMRISMRSRPNVDVSAIATALGGGGHRQAAGCTVDGPYEHAKATLIETYDTFHPR
jgi:phosphoesterase RecJ-like protein